MQRARFLLVVCLISLGLFAQQRSLQPASPQASGNQALPADAPSREDVLKLFDLMQIKKLTETTMQAVRQQAQTLGQQVFHEAIPNPTPEEQKLMDDVMSSTMAELLRSFPIDELLDTMIPVYQRHLSKSDLDAMIAFYSSPVGQKLLREQPQMIQESMQAMVPIQQRMMRDMMEKVQARVQHAIEQEQKKQREKATGGKS